MVKLCSLGSCSVLVGGIVWDCRGVVLVRMLLMLGLWCGVVGLDLCLGALNVLCRG